MLTCASDMFWLKCRGYVDYSETGEHTDTYTDTLNNKNIILNQDFHSSEMPLCGVADMCPENVRSC